MLLRIFSVLLVCFYPVLSDYQCVCTNHVSAKIFRTTNIHTEPIGYLYPDVGECKPTYNDSTHSQFVSLISYHQVGYVRKDKDIFVTNCIGHPSIDDTVTTVKPHSTSIPTTSHAHATSQSVQTPVCNKVALFMDIAQDRNIGTATSRICPDNVHYDADAVISMFCGAPGPSTWFKGRKVVDFKAAIQKYTPIGYFDGSNVYKGAAGVYLGFINSTLYMASQTCYGNLAIHGMTATSVVHKNQFYEIRW